MITHVGIKMVCESRDKEHTLPSRVRATHLFVGVAVAAAGRDIYNCCKRDRGVCDIACGDENGVRISRQGAHPALESASHTLGCRLGSCYSGSGHI